MTTPADPLAFRRYIAGFTTLTDAEWVAIRECLSPEVYPAGSTLLREGEVCRRLYFVETGLLRFHFNQDGDDVTKFFTIAPYCFTAQTSFRLQRPSGEAIEALEDCAVWELSQSDAYRLLELPGWADFIRELVQDVQRRTEDIMTEQRLLPAEQRYRLLLESEDRLVGRVPGKHLASFLGIAPQSLSRIRRRLAGGS